MKDIEINNEIFRNTGIRNYWVSKTGVVANIELENNEIIYFKKLKLEETKDKHLRVPLKIEKGKEKKFFVHRLVYSTFVGELKEGYVIDHIDANPKNNNVENLRQVTQRKNVENAIYHGNFGHNRDTKIKVVNTETNEIEYYDSIKEFLIDIEAPTYMIKHGGLSILKKRKEYDKYKIYKIDQQ